jgi:uncharacterized membrane protein
MAALDALGEKLGVAVRLDCLPGTFVTPARTLAHVGHKGTILSDDEVEIVRDAILIGQERSYDQDVRFGFVVLAEIAMRALSPAVNDPGTAIDVIGRGVRLLHDRARTPPADCPPKWPHVMVPEIAVADLLDDLFSAIARDGVAMASVHIRLQKAFGALTAFGDEALGQAARAQSADALARFRQGPATAQEKDRVARLAEAVRQRHPADGG